MSKSKTQTEQVVTPQNDTIETVVTPDAPEQQTLTSENVGNANDVLTQPKTPEQVYNDERQKLVEAWMNANTKYNDEFAKFATKAEGALSQPELMKLQLTSFKASQDLEKLDAAENKRLIQVGIENEKNARALVVDQLIEAVTNVQKLLVAYPLEGRTPEQNAEINTANAEAVKIADGIKTTLRDGIVKKEIHIPMGTTGAKLTSQNGGAKTGIINELIEVMKSGKTNDEIEAMYPNLVRDDAGRVHGSIRTARWKYNQSIK